MAASDRPSRSPSSGGFLRELTAPDLSAYLKLINRAPDAYSVVGERIADSGLNPARSGGRSYGYFVDDRLVSGLYAGANLTPICATGDAIEAFASLLASRTRSTSAIVGFAAEVIPLWEALKVCWLGCREVRRVQPFLVLDRDADGVGDPDVRPGTLNDLPIVMSPAIDMFTEEVGVSPIADGRAPSFTARVAASLLERRTYVRVMGGRVIFKAEVGAVYGDSCQLQGVWVAPDLRGQGIAAPALVAVAEHVRRDHAPRVGLYANDHNVAALRTYRRIGFQQIGTFTTVLF